MKGLSKIPSKENLQQAYEKLNSNPTIKDLALYSQWTRFDPRLGEILALVVSKSWKNILPTALNYEIMMQPWPQAFGVICEHAKILLQNRDKEERKQFEYWQRIALTGVERADHQQFFIGLKSVAGKLMLQDAQGSLNVYKKWGYLSKDLMINKSASVPKTVLSPDVRKQLLEQFMRDRESITVNEYMELLESNVSRKQAERDLRGFSKLKPKGFTRGRIYFKD